MKTQSEMENICLDCYYARERKDICGIYCVGSFFKHDGECNHWRYYKASYKSKKKKPAYSNTARKEEMS